jgi:hypothetical protein
MDGEGGSLQEEGLARRLCHYTFSEKIKTNFPILPGFFLQVRFVEKISEIELDKSSYFGLSSDI